MHVIGRASTGSSDERKAYSPMAAATDSKETCVQIVWPCVMIGTFLPPMTPSQQSSSTWRTCSTSKPQGGRHAVSIKKRSQHGQGGG